MQNLGLNHALEELDKLKFTLPFLPIEEQAKYADAICIENADKMHFLLQQFSNFNPYAFAQFEGWNATSIGNSAYIALHGVSSIATHKAVLGLLNYQRWLLSTKPLAIYCGMHAADETVPPPLRKFERCMIYKFPDGTVIKHLIDRTMDRFVIGDSNDLPATSAENDEGAPA